MSDFKSSSEQKNKTATPVQAPEEGLSQGEMEYVDSRASTFQLIQLQAAADDQGKRNRITQLQSKAALSISSSRIAQLQAKSDSRISSTQSPVVQREENKTGLPDGLKSGMEAISGLSLGDVKVHRNSDKPAQLQAHAYAQGTDIHLAPGQEKHLPHELGHVVQQKEGRVKPTVQLKDKVNINDDSGLEKEADVLGQKANSVGKMTEKGSEVGVIQQKGHEVLQGKFTQGSLLQFSKTPPIQLNEVGKAIAKINNVTIEQIDKVRPIKDQPLKKIKELTGLTEPQIATAQARLFGETKVQDMPEKVDGVRTEGPATKPRAATPWDKLVEANLSEESKSEVEAASIRIPEPKEFFGGEAGMKSHLGKFVNGVHAFITPWLSERILGTVDDPKFLGWGKDYNFVTPLSVGEEIHKKAEMKDGIITLEEELGLAKWEWVKGNPKKQMVRWIIPKPTDFDLPGEKFLRLATGNETGAIIDKWVAGGYTLGGVPEVVFKAIPREKLLFLLDKKQIQNPTVDYPKTPDYPTNP
uniref:eCIS core domain-containing protein n=1 Tax=Algoriphagus sp. TaxID=1872435 RepID=UPI004047B7E0